jgi:hypothetical protein
MRDLSPRSAARIAGVGLLGMTAIAIFGIVATQNVIVAGDAARTASSIMGRELLFRLGICGWLVVAILDVVVALALYIVLRRVNRSLSLLAAWFRLAYAAVFVASVANLLLAVQLLGNAAYAKTLGTVQLDSQAMLALDAFKNGWALGLVLFGIHLGLLGYLSYVSGFVPKWLGVLLLLASVSYLVANLGKILVPAYGGTLDAVTAAPAAIGELAFAIWLLVRASSLPDGEAG